MFHIYLLPFQSERFYLLMKRLIVLMLAVFSFFLSCQSNREEKALIDRAEGLTVSNPDSAYIILNSIAVPEMMSDKQLARWCMLSGRVSDKLFKDMPYVSQLTRALEWYKKYGTFEEQAWIGLYLGRSYFEDQLYLPASDAYSEALAVALKGKAYNVAGYICSYTADLYEYTGQTSEERRKCEEAAGYFEKAGNKRSYAFALRDISWTWIFDDSCSLALEYMLLADSIIRKSDNLDGIGEIVSGLGNIYRMIGETERARECYFKSLTLDTAGIAPVYSALGQMYCDIGELDSARLFLEKAKVKTLNRYTSGGVLYKQYEVEKADNNFEKALFYLEQYDAMEDSLYDSRKQADIIDAEKRYNQLLLLDENKELRIGWLVSAVLLSVCLSICLVGWIVYQEKNKRAICKAQELQQALEAKESRLRQLVAELREKEESDSLQEETLNKYKEEIKAIQEEIFQYRKTKFHSSYMMKKVKKLSSKVIVGNEKPLLTADDWEAIKRLLDATYVGLLSLLKDKEWNLTKAELEICYLSFFNLGVGEEAILLNIIPESVSKRRLRVRQKLGLENTSTLLNDYLTSHL